MAILDAHALGAPQRLLLDSAVWMAATTNVPGVVPPELLLILEQAAHDARVVVSAATVWELALLSRRGDIDFGDFSLWLADQTRPPGVVVLPITADVVYESTLLPGWVSPSASTRAGAVSDAGQSPQALQSSEAIDRFLVATSQQIGAVVVTTDPMILAYAASGRLHAYDARA